MPTGTGKTTLFCEIARKFITEQHNYLLAEVFLNSNIKHQKSIFFQFLWFAWSIKFHQSKWKRSTLYANLPRRTGCNHAAIKYSGGYNFQSTAKCNFVNVR